MVHLAFRQSSDTSISKKCTFHIGCTMFNFKKLTIRQYILWLPPLGHFSVTELGLNDQFTDSKQLKFKYAEFIGARLRELDLSNMFSCITQRTVTDSDVQDHYILERCLPVYLLPKWIKPISNIIFSAVSLLHSSWTHIVHSSLIVLRLSKSRISASLINFCLCAAYVSDCLNVTSYSAMATFH